MEQQLTNFEIERKEVTYFSELLDQAHQNGLKQIKTQIIQVPTASNGFLCIHHAEIQMDNNSGSFEGTGDASPDTVEATFVPHYIRVSETRAIVRALRFALNVPMVAIEELGGQNTQTVSKAQNRALKTDNSVTVFPSHQPSTEKQRKAIWGIAMSLNWSNEEIKSFIHQMFNCKLADLSKSQASKAIDHMKSIQSESQIA